MRLCKNENRATIVQPTSDKSKTQVPPKLNWDFTTTVLVKDPHPLSDYAEVECEVHVECQIKPGYEGDYHIPPEYPSATLLSSKVSEIRVLPIEDTDPDAEDKALLLMTKDMRGEIEDAATAQVEREWNHDYEERALQTHRDHHMGWDD